MNQARALRWITSIVIVGMCLIIAGQPMAFTALAEEAEPVQAAAPAPEEKSQSEGRILPSEDVWAVSSPDSAAQPQFPIAQGAQSETVRTLQNHLKTLGFLHGAADGAFGGATRRAVEMAQTHLGNSVQSAAAMSDWDAIPLVHVDGVVNEMLFSMLEDGFPIYTETLQVGSRGDQVTRLQTRLYDLEYIRFRGVDGAYGEGTKTVVAEFQKRNNLPQTGVADEATQKALYSASAVKGELPPLAYMLKVSVDDQRVYAYEWDGTGYNRKVRTMKCSTGLAKTPTPKGTFTDTGPGARWHYFKKFNCYAQYAYQIQGDILFHSVLYSQKNEKTLQKSSLNNLGRRASHGCVRLSVADARWIYTNCDFGTTVVVY